MRVTYKALAAAGGIAILSACTSGQAGVEPPFTAVNVQSTSSLQFRVGTANYQGTTVLNTVVTFRQPNGLSATLFNTPTITGPAGFVNTAPASVAGVDSGTNMISGTPPTQPGTPATATTFGQSGGAFSYGFAPANSTTSGAANYPKSSTSGTEIPASASNSYTQPVYFGATSKLPFMLGPPAVPDFHNPNLGFPASFAGYDSGFVMFGVTPVAGTYNLNVTVPSNTIGQNSAVFNVPATLGTLVPLAALPAPVMSGGAGTAISVTVAAVPAGVPAITARVVYLVVRQATTGTTEPCPGQSVCFFSFNAGTGAGTFTLPASTFVAGDRAYAYQVGADWDIVGDSAPINLSPTPPLPAQTDVTVSLPAGPTTF